MIRGLGGEVNMRKGIDKDRDRAKDKDRETVWFEAWKYYMNKGTVTGIGAIKEADYILTEFDKRFRKDD